MAKPPPVPRASRVTVPTRCHPAAKIVFAEMNRQGKTYDELSHYSGVQITTIKAWRTNNRPGLETLEAALGALGWAFLPVPAMDKVPATVREGLKALAEQWGDENALLCQLLATVSQAPIMQPAGKAEGVVATIRPKRRRGAVHPDQVALFEDAAA